MSEADAEDGLHGLDETTSGMNEGTTSICISFRPLPVSLQEARPAFLPPIPNSNPPPAKKNKDGEVAKGEGGTPRVLPRRGGIVRVSTESERKVKFRATSHAERANQSDSCSK